MLTFQSVVPLGSPIVRFCSTGVFLSILLAAGGCGGTGLVPPDPPPSPPPPPTGVLAGDTVSATIGPAGGSITVGGGAFSVTFPAGAVSKDTKITVWPFVATAPHAHGPEYAFEPAGLTLAKPVKVSVRIDPSTLGPDEFIDGLGFAQRTPAGTWEGSVVRAATSTGVGSRALGTTRPSDPVIVEDELPELPRTALVSFWKIQPTRLTVATSDTLVLRVLACFRVLDIDTRGALETTCGPSVREGSWFVNGHPGGTAALGMVAALSPSSQARYTAPSVAPLTPVPVEGRLRWRERGLTKVFRFPIVVTGSNDWTGTLTYSYDGTLTETSRDGATTVTTTTTRKGSGTIELRSLPGGNVNLVNLGATSYSAEGSERVITTAVSSGGSCTTTLAITEALGGTDQKQVPAELAQVYGVLVTLDADGYSVTGATQPKVDGAGTRASVRTTRCDGRPDEVTETTDTIQGSLGEPLHFVVLRPYDLDNPGVLSHTVPLHLPGKDWVIVTIGYDIRRR